MRRPRRAMVMAAGRGSRMGALTDSTPKPLLQAGGKALIDHALDRVEEGGAQEAVVNLHHFADRLQAHLSGRTRPSIAFSDERDALLETGGGVRNALPLLGEAPVYVVNSDAVWTGAAPLPALAEAWDAARMDALLLLARRGAARAYTRAGDFELGHDGRPSRRRGRTAPLVYTGAQIIRPGVFGAGPEGPFSTNLIWDALLARGRLFAIVHDGEWVDVGTPEGLAEAEAAISESAAR
ncbi:MAG: nucleotidyltransferase family protein [Pseudomonadota bacterium]